MVCPHPRRRNFLLLPLIGFVLFLFAGILPASAWAQSDQPAAAEQVLVRHADGSEAWYIPADDGSGALIPTDDGWSRFEISLFIFGLIGQVMFMSRFALQWIVSERAKRSIVPTGFWWLSLAGASILLTYYALRAEPIGILGQSFGWIVYTRNLYMIKRHQRLGIESATDPAEHPVPDPNAEM